MTKASLQTRLTIVIGLIFGASVHAATGATVPTSQPITPSSKDAGVRIFSSVPDQSTQGRLRKETAELQKIRKAAAILVKKEVEEQKKIHAAGGKINKKEAEILKKIRGETAALAQQESEIMDKINKDAALLLNRTLPSAAPTAPTAPTQTPDMNKK